MSEENIATSKRGLEEAFNRGNLDVIDEDTTEDFVAHDPITGEQDRESAKQRSPAIARRSPTSTSRSRTSSPPATRS